MLGYKKVVIARHERGLCFKDRSFDKLLGPGVYRYFDPLGKIAVEIYDLSVPEFEHPRMDFLLKEVPSLSHDAFQVVELGEREAGLVYKNSKLAGVLAPGTRQLYWKGAIEVRVDRVDIGDDYVVPPEVAVLLVDTRHGSVARGVSQDVYLSEVPDNQVGLLFVNGELQSTLKPGTYVYWIFQRKVNVELVDTRLQTMEVSGQEILTRDKVSLRVNLSASYQVKDPVKARTTVAAYKDLLYRELQFGLRQAVGTRSLDELLGEKGTLDTNVYEYIVAKTGDFGVAVSSVGVKDVILPGDMKEILNQVVEAEKVAQANVIKRREETAATRSLLNTARLMDENPTLLRLKELEMLEKVTGKIDKLTVFGGLEGVLQELVTIAPKQGGRA